MNHGARPLRSTRRLQNYASALPKWYSIVRNQAGPVLVSIYDEIGFYGVSAGEFMAELAGISGDIELHLNSPGGDVFDGIAIYNQLRAAQQRGQVRIIVDGLAASAASFIAMAASPGQLEMAPHSRMMIHDGFGMAIGNAADMREMADLLDDASDNIASMYAERTGKPAAYWRDKMRVESWYSGEQAVSEGLADRIHGQASPAADWDLSVFAHAPGAPAPAPVPAPVPAPRNAAEPEQLGDGWVKDPDGTVRFDPDGDGDDDSTPEGDTDHDYFAPDGTPKKAIPPRPDGASNRSRFPVLDGDVDHSAWDAAKAWHNGAESDDPAKFYAGICAGRKPGDPATQDAWALPYKYSPSDPPNADGVKAALSRLPQAEGLTNADEAKATLQKAMKVVNPDYDAADRVDPALVASVLTIPRADVDHSAWDVRAALAGAATSPDPAAFYAGICAGRKPGDPATAEAWALPFKYAPHLPPNADGVRAALAALPYAGELANAGQARGTLEAAMRKVAPGQAPDDDIDPALLAAAFTLGLEGAAT